MIRDPKELHVEVVSALAAILKTAQGIQDAETGRFIHVGSDVARIRYAVDEWLSLHLQESEGEGCGDARDMG